MNLLFTVLSLLVGHFAFCQNVKNKPKVSAIIDTTRSKDMFDLCSRPVPDNITGYWMPNSVDIKALENYLKDLISLRGEEGSFQGQKIDNIHSYALQYMGVLIGQSQCIYINAFPLTDIKRAKSLGFKISKDPWLPCHGGWKYWGVLFDTKSKVFKTLAFNCFCNL